MKVKALKKTYLKRSAGWHAGLFPAWNGLIIATKERPARLIKTLKPMDYVYVLASDCEVAGTAYFVGNGFVVRNYVHRSLEPAKSDVLMFVRNEEVICFSPVKFVGGRNVFKDKYDEEHKDMAIMILNTAELKE